MDKLLNKLRVKDESKILILNAPSGYLKLFCDYNVDVNIDLKSKYDFIQNFEMEYSNAEKIAENLISVLKDDGLLWLCYPKGSSKKYKSDINRNKSWGLYAAFEFEPVSQVSIDDDWSSIRYRNVDKIKTLKRKTAATEKGKERIKNNE